jgi:hypothetical protein
VASPIKNKVYNNTNSQTTQSQPTSICILVGVPVLAERATPHAAPASVPTGPVTKIPRSGPRLDSERKRGPKKPTRKAGIPTIRAKPMMSMGAGGSEFLVWKMVTE